MSRFSILSKPSVAAALSVLGGYAQRTQKDREDARKFGQQQSLLDREGLERNLERSMESQLRMTEAEKMRKLQTDNPTPLEQAQLESERARKASYDASAEESKARNSPEARQTLLTEKLMQAVIQRATTAMSTDPEGALAGLKLNRDRFKGNDEFDTVYEAAEDLAAQYKEAQALQKEVDAFNRFVSSPATQKMTDVDKLEVVERRYKKLLKSNPEMVEPFFRGAEAEVATQATTRQADLQRGAEELAEERHGGFFSSPTPEQVRAARRDVPMPAFPDSMAVEQMRPMVEGGSPSEPPGMATAPGPPGLHPAQLQRLGATGPSALDALSPDDRELAESEGLSEEEVGTIIQRARALGLPVKDVMVEALQRIATMSR